MRELPHQGYAGIECSVKLAYQLAANDQDFVPLMNVSMWCPSNVTKFHRVFSRKYCSYAHVLSPAGSTVCLVPFTCSVPLYVLFPAHCLQVRRCMPCYAYSLKFLCAALCNRTCSCNGFPLCSQAVRSVAGTLSLVAPLPVIAIQQPITATLHVSKYNTHLTLGSTVSLSSIPTQDMTAFHWR